MFIAEVLSITTGCTSGGVRPSSLSPSRRLSVQLRWYSFTPRTCTAIDQLRSDQITLHFLQPHQADQVSGPAGEYTLTKNALTNLATPIRSSCHVNGCMQSGPNCQCESLRTDESPCCRSTLTCCTRLHALPDPHLMG